MNLFISSAYCILRMQARMHVYTCVQNLFLLTTVPKQKVIQQQQKKTEAMAKR